MTTHERFLSAKFADQRPLAITNTPNVHGNWEQVNRGKEFYRGHDRADRGDLGTDPELQRERLDLGGVGDTGDQADDHTIVVNVRS